MINTNRKIFLKRVAIAATVLLVTAGTSCKRFTDLQPLDALSTTTAFANAANIELAMNGVYNTAAVGTYNGGAGRGYPFGGASIEQGEMRGEDMVNIAAFYAITYQNTYDATTANNVNMWVNLYQLINQANTFIDGVRTAGSKGIISAAAAASYEGEARFMRALAHHELVIMFCRPYLDGAGAAAGVPYRVTAVNSQAAVDAATSQPRGTVAQDYTGILADLDYAEQNITLSTNGINRATAGAAIALKTRVKLHMGDWAGVITEGTKLGTSTGGTSYTSPIGNAIGKYKLTASPDGPFASPAANANNSESIFSVAASVTANGGPNGALPAMLGPADKSGRGLVATSPNLYNASYWVNGDLRRTLLQVQQLSPSTAKYYFNYKYRDYTNLTDWAPIIRYAEVLLNVAEAYSRTGNLVNSLGLLNAVRNRSVLTTADQYTAASFTTGLAMTQAILNERRIEFAGEGRRWEDIHRLANDPNFAQGGGGVPAKILIGQIAGSGSDYNLVTRPMINTSVAPPASPALPYSNFRFIWPIPASETLINPNITQNPGY